MSGMDDVLKELQLEYIQSIPAKITEIKNFLAQKDIDSLINSFHKLKGSGKTYGIAEVSSLGQFFELWMREKKDSVLPFIPVAAELLQRIYSHRQKNMPFAIEQDPDFVKLQSIK